MNRLFMEALDASSAFDADLKELSLKKLTLDDLAKTSNIPAKRKAQIFKGLARNLWKAYENEPLEMMVRAGYADDAATREAQLLEAMGVLQSLYADAYLEANAVPPATPLGYFAIRLGEAWLEIYTLKGARDPEIQSHRGVVKISNNFG